MNVCYNLHYGHSNGMYVGEARDSVSTCLRFLGEGYGDGNFAMSHFFDNLFQRMITLIDELKTLDHASHTREVLDNVEKLNFIRPDLSPRVDYAGEAMGEKGDR